MATSCGLQESIGKLEGRKTFREQTVPRRSMPRERRTKDQTIRASRGLRLSILLRASICHPSPKIRASTVCPGAGKEAINSGFDPVKALVRPLPLPRPPSFQVRLGSLPLLRPIMRVGTTSPLRGSTRGARLRMDRLQEGRTRVQSLSYL